MKTKFFSYLILLIIVIGMNGCSKNSSYLPVTTVPSGGGGGGGGGTGGPGPNEVWMQNTAFVPSTLTVAVGTTVTWTNKDATTHDVTYLTGPVVFGPSGTLSQNGTFSFMFNTPGTYTYHCTIHVGMNGTIIVQ